MTSAPSVSENPEAKRGLDRRTVVRGAVATAWAVPAVTLVTAAPAFAVSSVLTVSSFTATYSTPGASTVNTSKLTVAATLGNTGAQTTTGLVFTLTIPANLYSVAPTATAPTGFGAPEITGSLTAGWTIAYTATSQIAAGGSTLFSTQISFNDPVAAWTDAPFRKWAGSAFNLAATATATNAVATAGSAAVAAVTSTVNTFTTTSQKYGSATGSGGNKPRNYFTIPTLFNAGRATLGQLTLQIKIDRGNWATSLWDQKPDGVENLHADWNYIGVAEVSGQWVMTFTSKKTAFTPATGVTGGAAFDRPVPASGTLGFNADLLANYDGGLSFAYSGVAVVSASNQPTPVSVSFSYSG